MTTTAPMQTAAAVDGDSTRAANEDFRAAMHEIESNIEVRRLMFILSPGSRARSSTACSNGTHSSP